MFLFHLINLILYRSLYVYIKHHSCFFFFSLTDLKTHNEWNQYGLKFWHVLFYHFSICISPRNENQYELVHHSFNTRVRWHAQTLNGLYKKKKKRLWNKIIKWKGYRKQANQNRQRLNKWRYILLARFVIALDNANAGLRPLRPPVISSPNNSFANFSFIVSTSEYWRE